MTEERKRIPQSKIIEKYGFTKKLIEEFLPEPECVPNPWYRNAPDMKLWYEEDIIEIIKTDEFIQAFEKVKKRKKSAKKAVETKKAKTEEELTEFVKSIEVYIHPDSTALRSKVLREKENWYYSIDCEREYPRYTYEDIVYTADEGTVQRWTVNYIRHNYVNYDEYLYSLFGKVGKYECYTKAKQAVLEKIAEVYPYLKAECVKQINRL